MVIKLNNESTGSVNPLLPIQTIDISIKRVSFQGNFSATSVKILQDNLILLIEVIMSIDHHKEV